MRAGGHGARPAQLILPLGFDGIRRRAEENWPDWITSTIENFSGGIFWRSVIICREGFPFFCVSATPGKAQAQMSGGRAKRRADLSASRGSARIWPATRRKPCIRRCKWSISSLWACSSRATRAGIPPACWTSICCLSMKKTGSGASATRKPWKSSNACGSRWASRSGTGTSPPPGIIPAFCAFQNIALGGLDTHGRDAVNTLTYLMLQAGIDVQMVQPSLSVRISKKNPEVLSG